MPLTLRSRGTYTNPDDDTAYPEVTGESLPARVKEWHLHAPAERVPPSAALLTWPGSWLLHETHIPGHWAGLAGLVAVAATAATWAKHNSDYRRAVEAGWDTLPPERLTTGEATLITAAIAGWITAAVTWGPMAGPWHLLTITYLVTATGLCVWLRKHRAVRAARQRRDNHLEWTETKSWWNRISHRPGLGDFYLQEATPTNLGRQLLLTSDQDATPIASRPATYERALCGQLGLPLGSVSITGTQWFGQLVVDIREVDPSVNGPIIHPAINSGSPHAHLFPADPSVRDALVWGLTPETGDPLTLRLWERGQGGRTIIVVAATGEGKTMILNGIRERVTLMDDAIMIQINGANVGDEMTWAPLAAATAAGAAQSDPSAAAKILRTLEWLQAMVTARTATAAETGDATFQPTPQDPALVIFLDEIDEIARIPGAKPILQFLASKQRKAAITMVIAGQRYTQDWMGGGGVLANVAQVLVGRLGVKNDRRRVSGNEALPDISEYSKGEPGFFYDWDPRRKATAGRGRGFDFKEPRDQKPVIAARVAAGRAAHLPAGPTLVLDEPQDTPEPSEDSRPSATVGGMSMRDRLAQVVNLDSRRPAAAHSPGPANPEPSRQPQPAPVAPKIPGVPPVVAPVLLAELHGEGTTAQQLADALSAKGISVGKTTAYKYLTAAADAKVAALDKRGSASRYQLAVEVAAEEAPQTEGYVTAEEFAAAAARGEVPGLDDTAREVLNQAHEATLRATGTDDTPPAPETGDEQ